MIEKEIKDEALNSVLRKIDGVDKWMTRGEIKELPSILWGNELPEKLITGTYNNGKRDISCNQSSTDFH